MAPSKKVCPECGTEVYAMHLPRHLLTEHGLEPAAKPEPASAPPVEPSDRASAEGAEVAPSSSSSDETAPRKPGLLERFRSRRGRGRGGQHQAPASGERAPKRPKRGGGGRRVPLDVDISDIWAFGGRRLERTAHYPTGRMLQFQAPAAGVIFDRAIAGTLPDRLLFQPIARNRDKYEDVAFLIAGPLITFGITQTGQQMQAAMEAGDKEAFDALARKLEVQREAFLWVLQMMLPRLAEGAKKAREKKAKADAAIADAFPDLGDEDPTEVLASMLFEPPTFHQPQQQEASQNGTREPGEGAAQPRPEGAVPL